MIVLTAQYCMHNKQTNKQTMEYKGEEIKLFRLMKQALADHKRRTVRMKYYPHNMDEWEAEHKVIEKNYRQLIGVVRKERLAEEREQNEQNVTQALLMLKESTEKDLVAKKKREDAKKKRAEKKAAAKNVVVVPRKSSRIANKKK